MTNIKEGILLDNRPDFLDVVSKEVTGSTVKQHVQNAVKNKINDVTKNKVVKVKGKNNGPTINKDYNKTNNGSGMVKVKNSTLNPHPKAGRINVNNSNSASGQIKKATEAFERNLNKFDSLLLEACSKVEELQGQKEKNEKGMKNNPLKAQELARKAIAKGIEDKIKKLEENFNKLDEVCTSVAVMAPFPVDLAGKEQPSKNKKGKQKKAMLGYKFMKIRKAQ